jgi:assimilatory nitrate reductase catalytic subunit
VIHIRKAVEPPGNAWQDSRIYVELARRLGKGRFFPYREPREIFDELRLASRGGIADYSGITYEKIDAQLGVFWPCTSPDDPGTPRLFEGGRFFHPDGKARFLVTPWRPGGDPVDHDFPVYLTTGRVVSQYLSGTQTRRIGALVDQHPWPRLEIHPHLAEPAGIATGDWVTVTTRRGAITIEASVVRTIRPDTVFIAYHWPGGRSANRLTHRTLDPRSKIPEFKVSACRIERAAQAPEYVQSEATPGLPRPGRRLPIVSPGSPPPLADAASRRDSSRLAAFVDEPEGGR